MILSCYLIFKVNLMENFIKKNIHIIPIIILSLIFGWIVYKNLIVTNKKIRIDRENLTNIYYQNNVSLDDDIKKIGLTFIEECNDRNNEVCIVQAALDFVTNIDYKINKGVAKKPIDTIKRNYGDCDDKSNLLSSILKSLEIENYIVIVPNHAFVIVRIQNDSDKELILQKGLYIDGQKFYILETTAKNSKIGFKNIKNISDIKAVIEPFENEKIDIVDIEYKI